VHNIIENNYENIVWVSYRQSLRERHDMDRFHHRATTSLVNKDLYINVVSWASLVRLRELTALAATDQWPCQQLSASAMVYSIWKHFLQSLSPACCNRKMFVVVTLGLGNHYCKSVKICWLYLCFFLIEIFRKHDSSFTKWCREIFSWSKKKTFALLCGKLMWDTV